MPRLNTKLWGARFQALWIVAAAVLTVVQSDATKWGPDWKLYASTSSLVVCCLILTTACASVLHSVDVAHNRNIILVALTASAYMVVLSLGLDDPTGLGFSLIGTVLFMNLLWQLDDAAASKTKNLVNNTFIVVTAGSSGALIGMLFAYVVVAQAHLRSNSTVGITSAAALTSILVGVSYGHRGLMRALPVGLPCRSCLWWKGLWRMSVIIALFGTFSIRLSAGADGPFDRLWVKLIIASSYLLVTGYGCLFWTHFALEEWRKGRSAAYMGAAYLLAGLGTGIVQGICIWIIRVRVLTIESVTFTLLDNVLLSIACFVSVWVAVVVANAISEANMRTVS